MLRASKSETITANAQAAAQNNWALTSGSPAGFACRSRTRTRRNLPGMRTTEDSLVVASFFAVARRRFPVQLFLKMRYDQIPRSCGLPPFSKGAIGGFVAPKH